MSWMSTPAMRSREANVCRRSFQWDKLIPSAQAIRACTARADESWTEQIAECTRSAL
jgi:hypothetical protein